MGKDNRTACIPFLIKVPASVFISVSPEKTATVQVPGTAKTENVQGTGFKGQEQAHVKGNSCEHVGTESK